LADGGVVETLDPRRCGDGRDLVVLQRPLGVGALVRRDEPNARAGELDAPVLRVLEVEAQGMLVGGEAGDLLGDLLRLILRL